MSTEDVPVIPELKGSIPGVLDPTQTSRLLRKSDSTLFFASFDPNIAVPYNIAQLGNMSLNDQNCRPKRIVIETIPGVGSFWRWVPRARLREYVPDEGGFPRVVRVCGEPYIISQEQWDIYKLDPLYDCFVDDFSCLSVISKKDSTSYGGNSSDYSSSWSNSHSQKRPSTHPNQHEVSIDGEDDMMEIDDDNNYQSIPKVQPRVKRKVSPRPPFYFNFGNGSTATSPPATSKRNANVSFQNLRDPEEEENDYFEQDSQSRNTKQFIPKIRKRARTMSPLSQQRAASAQKEKWKNAKQAKMDREKAERILRRERDFEREILADVHQTNFSTNGLNFGGIPEENEDDENDIKDPPSMPPPEPAEVVEDEDEANARRIAESRRKMEELNTDRDRQRQREKLLREEMQEARRAKTEGPSREQIRRQKVEEELWRQAEAKLQEEQKQARLRQEQMRRRAELMAGLQEEREARHRPWDYGRWDHARAVERYRHVGHFFDKAKFSSETLPLTVIDIPWPTLRHPKGNTPRDMDYETVTDFFRGAKEALRGQEYKEIMKSSFHRFHPDRWNSRNLYSAVLDEQERDEILTAVNTVSKAIGALYSDSRNC